MHDYKAYNLETNKLIIKIQCSSCGYWVTVEDSSEFASSNKFTLEFSTVSGNKGKFYGTKEEIQRAIDKFEWSGFNNNTYTEEHRLRQIANCIEILKYGYEFEFKENDYIPYEITVDNGLWMKIRYGIR